MYGSHEHTLGIEIEREINFDIGLTCTSRGCAAQLYGEPGDCYPSEAPEFELDTIHVHDEVGNPHKITWDMFVAFVGDDVAELALETSIQDAVESGDF